MAKKGLTKFWLVFAVIAVIFLPPFAKYQGLRYKNGKLDRDMKDLKKEVARLEIDKKRLETDITYIEGRARDKIGVVRKGEIVMKETAKKK